MITLGPWTSLNDRLSVTVGINARIGILKQQKKTPKLIRLGGWASRQFMREHGLDHVPRETFYYAKIPIVFNDPVIIGIAVEGE